MTSCHNGQQRDHDWPQGPLDGEDEVEDELTTKTNIKRMDGDVDGEVKWREGEGRGRTMATSNLSKAYLMRDSIDDAIWRISVLRAIK